MSITTFHFDIEIIKKKYIYVYDVEATVLSHMYHGGLINFANTMFKPNKTIILVSIKKKISFTLIVTYLGIYLNKDKQFNKIIYLLF